MSKGTILVVEPDEDIRNMLNVYFSGQGYQVLTCSTVHEALHSTHKQLPSVILTEIDLPDKSGFDLCRELRTTTRTSHIPIIFITHRSTRDDKINGLELGADDYVVKPIDIDELGKRIEHVIDMMTRTDKRPSRSQTGLPTGQWIEEHLRKIIQQDKQWIYIDIQLSSSEAYKEVYGWSKWDKVTIKFADLLREVWQDDYLAHPGGNWFLVISEKENWQPLLEELAERFRSRLVAYYDEADIQRGASIINGIEHPLMGLSFGTCESSKLSTKDIREIFELVAEDRRRKDPKYVDNAGDSEIVTHW